MKTETVIIISTAAALVVAFIATAVGAIRKSTANPEPEQPEPATIMAKIDTAIPRPPKVVRAPEGCKNFLTAGKEYPVIGIWVGYNTRLGYGFKITTDMGGSFDASERECAALNGGDWIVVEREGDVERQPSVDQKLTEFYANSLLEVSKLRDKAEAKVKELEGELEAVKAKHEDYKKEIIDVLQLRVEQTASAEQQRDNAQAEQRKTQLKLELAENKRDTYKKVLNMWCTASTKHFYTNSVHSFDKAAENAFILRNTLYRERNQARALATDLRKQLDRALVVIKDLEEVNGQLLAIVQGEDEQPEAKPLRLVTDLVQNECIHCPTEREAEAICKLMHEAGLRFYSGMSLLEHNTWTFNKQDTVYYPKGVHYGSLEFSQEKGNTIHPASDFLPTEFYAEPQQPTTTDTAIDWTKPVAFPRGYKVPEGVICTTLVHGDYGGFITPKGTMVRTIEESFNPFIERLDGVHKEKSPSHNYRGYTDKCFSSYELAPENPADHPLHPEFKRNVNSLP